MHEENLANDIRRNRICGATSDSHEDAGCQKAVEVRRQARPHAGEDEQQETDESDRSPPKGVRQRDPPEVGKPQHQDVDSREMSKCGERLGWQAEYWRTCVDRQSTGNRRACEVDREWMYRHAEQHGHLAPHGQIQGVGRI